MHTHVIRTTEDKLEATVDEWLGDTSSLMPQVIHKGSRDYLVVVRHPEHPDREHDRHEPHGEPAYDVAAAERVRHAIRELLSGDGELEQYADDIGGAHAPVLPSVQVAIEQSFLDDRRRAEDPVLTDERRAELAQFEDGRRGGLQWGAAKEWQRWRRVILDAAASPAFTDPAPEVRRDDLAFAASQLQAHVAADAGIKVDARRCNETAARFRQAVGGAAGASVTLVADGPVPRAEVPGNLVNVLDYYAGELDAGRSIEGRTESLVGALRTAVDLIRRGELTGAGWGIAGRLDELVAALRLHLDIPPNATVDGAAVADALRRHDHAIRNTERPGWSVGTHGTQYVSIDRTGVVVGGAEEVAGLAAYESMPAADLIAQRLVEMLEAAADRSTPQAEMREKLKPVVQLIEAARGLVAAGQATVSLQYAVQELAG